MGRAEAYRQIVEARAGGACEYCRLSQLASGVTFHLEHVVPQYQGGRTDFLNLAFSCPSCNLAKAERTRGKDNSGGIQPLYNPRIFEGWTLGWHLHFALDRDSGIIIPRTRMGEATVNTLKMNEPRRVFARRIQIHVGLIG
jgi:hypothetical protein